MTSTNIYGYGDATPANFSKLGYESTSCDTEKYGYGPIKEESNNAYGYGDSSSPYGYGDQAEKMEQPPIESAPGDVVLLQNILWKLCNK